HLQDGCSWPKDILLRQVSKPELTSSGDASAIGSLLTGEHLQQCRFSRAIGANEASSLSVFEMKRDPGKQRPGAERFGQGVATEYQGHKQYSKDDRLPNAERRARGIIV